MIPTSFAFGDGAVFEGDGGLSNGNTIPNGGLYLLRGKRAKKVGTELVFVAGLEFHAGTLYASGATLAGQSLVWQIFAFRNWNGTTFTAQKVIYTAPAGFQGFNGLGFGADGRLYVGVDVGYSDNNDHGPASSSPYVYDILTMSPSGGQVNVFASGIRQPWQMAFPRRSNSPFVTDFGQNEDATNPPDFLLRVRAGQNYGFPACNWTTPSVCAGDAKPLKIVTPHIDLGGVAIVGNRLYVSEFGYDTPKHRAEVVSLPLSGAGNPKTIVHDLPGGDSIIGLGASAGLPVPRRRCDQQERRTGLPGPGLSAPGTRRHLCRLSPTRPTRR